MRLGDGEDRLRKRQLSQFEAAWRLGRGLATLAFPRGDPSATSSKREALFD